MTMSRRLPVPTELSSGFWAAAAEHRLAVPCCEVCGARFFPPERICPTCGSPNWEYADSAGSGIVATFTVVHRAPSPDFETPYVVAVVELDEGCSILTNLVHTDPGSVSIGMPVHVVFLDQPDGRALPVFAAGVDARPDLAEKG
jgi:uncharacterized OB-fold protein